METLQSTIFIEFDVNTKKITFLRGDNIVDYDSSATSVYVRVKYKNLSGNTVYMTPSELEDYKFSLYTIKPATNNVNIITGKVTDELKENVYGGVVKFEIPGECTNRLGIVKCEIHINQENKIIGSSTFVLDVKQSLVTAFDDELLGDEDFPVLKQLILEIQKASNIDDNNRSKITTYSSNKVETIKEDLKKDFDSQIKDNDNKIENIKEDLSSQIKEKANESEVVKKGYATLNDFDEDTRAVLQGLEPGQINAVLGIGNVNPLNTTFMRRGLNLLNEKLVSQNSFINQSDGTKVDHDTYCCTDYILIEPNTQYYIRWCPAPYMATYNFKKEYVDEISYTRTGEYNEDVIITTGPNSVYLRYTIQNKDRISESYICKGNEKPSIKYKYEEVLDEEYLPQIPLSKIPYELINKKISIEELNFSETKNLFNKNDADIIKNKYMTNTGDLFDNTNYSVTHFIRVSEGETINVSEPGFKFTTFFDKNKQVVANGSNPSGKKFIVPEGVYYIRGTIYNRVSNFMVNKGDSPLPYQEYGYKIPSSYIDTSYSKNGLLVFLPSEICVAVGRTIELYNNQVVWCGDYSKYHFQWKCQIGNAMKRKFTIEGKTVGETPLTLTIYDSKMNPVATATSTIKVVSNVIDNPKQLLTIGDSLTNGKPWLQELRTLSGDKITHVGTRGYGSLKHEGRSGFTAHDYLTKTSYDYEREGIHKFWNDATNRFDWNYYKTQNNVNPDAVQIFLGTNGISLDPTSNANNIKQIIDYIRQDDANIPIFVVYTLYKANQNGLGVQTGNDGYMVNKGAWKLEEDRKVFNLMVKLNELLKGYTDLHFVPISTCHDSEYNFGNVERNVNPRSTIKEYVPIEATHPQNEGYMQFADIMFSVMCKYQ